MIRIATFALALLLPAAVLAQGTANPVRDAAQRHILPRYEALSDSAHSLEEASAQTCDVTAPKLREAYDAAFDAWIAVSHLRFGPGEVDDRAFALAFWPDTRGITPRALRTLITDADPIVTSAEAYSDVSIAARGYYALEMMLFDPEIQSLGDAQYRCDLMRVMTADIANLADAILADWQGGYADKMTNPGDGSPYRGEAEALQELFKALTYGLEFTSDTRLGRPLGTFDKPRPKQAEAWRAGRSLRNVALSLTSLNDLAAILAQRDPGLRARLNEAFSAARADADKLEDPVFAGVSEPTSRLRVESLQQSIDRVRDIVRDDLGPALGVASGFNSMDGD
ncbi:imelysin family protein [Roseovarius sp. S4756]|uniref:imelysin family protein n=1 Tax=Roseovarius maritimus TaxID=3342637 RepID=UPI00372BFCEA